MAQLIRYEQMRTALAEARTLDEVKDVADKAEAMRHYARRAHDPEMERWFAEYRFLSYLKLGRLSRQYKGEAGRPRKNCTTSGTISRRAAWRDAEITLPVGARAVTLARHAKRAHVYLKRKIKQRKPPSVTEFLRELKREERVDEITREVEPLGESEKLYRVLYADPPWRYEHVKTENRSIENQYPTMELDEIKSLEVPAAGDAVLFLWATSPKLTEALEVMDAWGFTYRTCMVWVKDKIGMGYYARQRHEMLLIGTRGSLPTPEPSNRPDSVVEADRGRHSEKPDVFYKLIETMYPEYEGLRIELFARQERDGWEPWGFEA